MAGTESCDVTKRTEREELIEERDLLQAILDAIPIAVYYKDKDHRHIRVSKGYYTMYEKGYGKRFGLKLPKDVRGKTVFDLFLKEHAEKYFEDDRRVMEKGESIIDKVELVTGPDGTESYDLASKVPRFDEKGNVIGMVGTSQDITEQMKLEKELTYERDLLQSLLNTLPHSVYFKDREGRLIRVSRYFLQLTPDMPPLAKSIDEVIGKTDFDLFPEWLAKATAEDEKRIIETGEPIIDKEERSLAPNGSEIYLSTTKAPLLDEKGDVIGIVGITRDITQHKKAIMDQIGAEKETAVKRASAEAVARVAATISEAAQRYKDTIDELKQAQKKLTEESNLFQNFLDNIPAFIFINDRDGRYLRVSKFYQMIQPESMIGKTAFDLYPEDEARVTAEDDKRVMETGKPIIDEERRFTAPDGSERHVLITKAPLFDRNGNIIGIVGIAREKT